MTKDSNFDWSKRTAIQIVVDRFARSGDSPKPMSDRVLKDWNDRVPNWQPDQEGKYKNDFFYGGNLKGVEDNLEYLKKLGFDMIYLTPIEESSSYHHYDVGNQEKIDSWIGSWNDLRSLCAKAKEFGIIIVCDLVFNHTGVNSVYFNNSQYSSWYRKNSDGSFSYWWGFKDLVEIDTKNEDYRETMKRVVLKYLENGVAGIRLDLGENLSREFLYTLQEVKEQFPNMIFIGEMWELASRKQDGKIFDGQLDSIMNYPLADAILRYVRYGYVEHFQSIFNEINDKYPVEVKNVLLNNLGTHDTPMTLSMLSGEGMNPDVFSGCIWDIESPWRHGEQFDTFQFRKFEADHDTLTNDQYREAENLSKVAIAIMYSMPGIPCIFQGTEIGDTGYKDPFCRKPYKWNFQNDSMKVFISSLGFTRQNNYDIFSGGKAKILYIDGNILIFERYIEENNCRSKIVLAVNRTGSLANINFPYRNEESQIIYKIGYGTCDDKIAPYGILMKRF